MRKSTIGLALLFLLCLGAWGWKNHIRPENIKDRTKEWVMEISMKQLRNFLDWRNPEAMLLAEQEERERLLEAEQQAYAILAENNGTGKSAYLTVGAEKQDASKGNHMDTGKKQESDSGNTGPEKENADKEINKKNQEKTKEQETTGKKERKEEQKADLPVQKTAAGSVAFPELVKTATGSSTSRYTWKQLTDFSFLTEHFYQINSNTTIYPSQLDGEACLKKSLAINRDTKGPQILIYHTHGSEYFKDSDKNKPETLITGVGDELTRILEEKYGYQVYHDTTVFPYNSSYSMGRERVKELLKKYPDIQVIIDLHRDSSPDKHLAVDLNGKKTAQIMFFNGMSQTKEGPIESRKNENLKNNLAFSLQLKLAAEQLYPGFARKNFLKPYRYNMDLAGCYTLIECGAETNTLEEELNAMEPLAEILHCVLQ